MLGGYAGKFLWVNLTTGKMKEEIPDESLLRDFIGGYGVAARIIYNRQKAGADPLGPANIFGLVIGPLTGTPAPTGVRWTVVGKSPLTGTWGDGNAGGFFGPALKFAGYDAIFFSGTSGKPVYLLIDEGKAELRDASRLWGKDTYETEDLLKAEFGDKAEVVCIGPAGENLSLMSKIMHYKGKSAGRGGLGAVMGSKKLKAIVARGSKEPRLANRSMADELRRKYVKEIANGIGYAHTYRDEGTYSYIEPGVRNNDSPIKNWAGVGSIDFPDVEAIGFNAIVRAGMKWQACWRCPIGCWGHMEVEYQGSKVWAHVPEYETTAAFGSDCLNNNLASIVKANELCNRYGLDTISTGATIAFAIECYENGLISKEDTDGIELTWGNHEAIIAMTEKLARREGFGDVLADGVRVAAEKIGRGAEQYAIHIMGQELPMHDPRYEPGLGLIYKIDATPGRHTQAFQYTKPPGLDLDIPNYGEDREQQAGRGRHLKILSELCHVVSASGLCLFCALSTHITILPEFLTAVTGHEYTLDDLLIVGERIANMRQAFNVREGINAITSPIPQRAYGIPPLEEGPTKGISVDIDAMLKEYLEEMDWSLDSAKPSARKLVELGLEDVAQDLWGESLE